MASYDLTDVAPSSSNVSFIVCNDNGDAYVITSSFTHLIKIARNFIAKEKQFAAY